MFINYKENNNFTVEKAGRYYFNQVTKMHTIRDKPKLRDMYKTTGLLNFKCVKVMKIKGRPYCSRLEQTKEI